MSRKRSKDALRRRKDGEKRLRGSTCGSCSEPGTLECLSACAASTQARAGPTSPPAATAERRGREERPSHAARAPGTTSAQADVRLSQRSGAAGSIGRANDLGGNVAVVVAATHGSA